MITRQTLYLVFTIGPELYYTILPYGDNKKPITFTNKIKDDLTLLPWVPQIKGVGENNELLGVIYPSRIINIENFNNTYNINLDLHQNPLIAKFTLK